MKFKISLIKGYIADVICNQISDFEFDEKEIIEIRATNILSEIQAILYKSNVYDDFEMIEQILAIFDKYHLDYGTCHDF